MTWYWVNFAVFAAGVVIGVLLKWGYLRVHGFRVRVPYVDRSDASIGIAVVVITVMSLVTVVQTQINTDRAESCNRQFRVALQHNADLTDEQRRLTAESRDISRDHRELQDRLFVDLGDHIGDVNRVRNIIAEYNSQSAQFAEKYDQLIEDSQSLNNVRKPYPAPECGR